MTNKIFDAGKAMILVFSLLLAPIVMAQTKVDGKKTKARLDGPRLFTQKGYFNVGEKVRISGQQFAPFEMITVSVESTGSRSGQRSLMRSWSEYSDAKGYVNFEWTVPSKGTFEIKVIGSESQALVKKSINGSNLTPTPIFMTGNPNCEVLDVNPGLFPQVVTGWGFKLDFGNPNGTFPFINSVAPSTILLNGAPVDPGNSVTTTTTNGGRDLAWSSTRPITVVIVKGGSGANVYAYSPDSLGDSGPLTSPDPNIAISHIEFCHQPTAKINIVKHATPPSSFQFDFSTTGLATTNFSLTDVDVSSDPMTMLPTSVMGVKRITETNPFPFTLQSIVCTVDIGTGGTPAPTVGANFVDIDIKAGDQVTCTFNNDFVTAAQITVSGRVFDPFGSPLSRAWVSITDSNGNTRSAMTNSFGYYQFAELEAGTSYFFNVAAKGFSFSAQVVTLDGDRSGVDFTAAPN